MDLNMPIMDGFEAVTKIRKILPKKDHLGRKLFVIGTTAQSIDNTLESRCIHAGFNDVLTKPVVRKKLQLIIQKYLIL